MKCLLPHLPMSLGVVSALCLTDNAPGEPLQAFFYLCKHSNGDWTAHMERHDPDYFPGTKPGLGTIHQRKARQGDDAAGWRLFEEAFQAELTSGEGLTVCSGTAPRAHRLSNVYQKDLEAQALASPFHSQLYANLTSGRFEHKAPAMADPRSRFSLACDEMIRRTGCSMATRVPLSLVLRDMAMSQQDGPLDVLPHLLSQAAGESTGLMSPSMSAYLNYVIEQTLEECGTTSMTYLTEHFVQVLKNALEPLALASAT